MQNKIIFLQRNPILHYFIKLIITIYVTQAFYWLIWEKNDFKMTNAGFNLQQCSFLSEFQYLQIILLLKNFYIFTRSSFLSQ